MLLRKPTRRGANKASSGMAVEVAEAEEAVEAAVDSWGITNRGMLRELLVVRSARGRSATMVGGEQLVEVRVRSGDSDQVLVELAPVVVQGEGEAVVEVADRHHSAAAVSSQRVEATVLDNREERRMEGISLQMKTKPKAERRTSMIYKESLT